MRRTVFYSWQSDLDPKFNRNLIEDALERALKAIKRDEQGWVERSDTHPGSNDDHGFREARNPSRDLLPDGQITCAIDRPPSVQPLFEKIF